MDGHFVPNLTLGPAITEAVRRSTELPVDVHLMIDNPELHLDAFARAGADRLTVHEEVCADLRGTLRRIRDLGVRPGVALNPDTQLDAVLHVLSEVDLLLVMSVHPGFGGQAYIPATTAKLERARRLLDELGSQAELEVDGGVDAGNAAAIAAAGASVLVAGSAVFRHEGGATGGARALREALR
jgi:ribulose-phosphate 3-epimerase